MGVREGDQVSLYWTAWGAIAVVVFIGIWRIGTMLGRIADALKGKL